MWRCSALLDVLLDMAQVALLDVFFGADRTLSWMCSWTWLRSPSWMRSHMSSGRSVEVLLDVALVALLDVLLDPHQLSV